MATVEFTRDAVEDLQALDGSALRYVLGAITKLEVDPTRGETLGSRQIGDLTGFRKLVVGDRQWRIVYQVNKAGDVCVLHVIASRVDAEVYELAIRRLEEYSDRPEVLQLADAMKELRPARARQVVRIRPDWAAHVDDSGPE